MVRTQEGWFRWIFAKRLKPLISKKKTMHVVLAHWRCSLLKTARTDHVCLSTNLLHELTQNHNPFQSIVGKKTFSKSEWKEKQEEMIELLEGVVAPTFLIFIVSCQTISVINQGTPLASLSVYHFFCIIIKKWQTAIGKSRQNWLLNLKVN